MTEEEEKKPRELNNRDAEAEGEFITTCFNLNDTLDATLARYAAYGFQTACDYMRQEHLIGLQAENEQLKAKIESYEDKVYHTTRRLEELEHFCSKDKSEIEKLKTKLEKAVDALKYVAMDYPKSYIHDSDYERCKWALKEIEGE